MTPVVVALAGAAAAWLAGGRMAPLGGARTSTRPADDPTENPTEIPTEIPTEVDVVIPARNEAGALPRLLSSLQRSQVRPRRVIVVDDGSTDATAELARAAGAEVMEAGGPPAGWTGKCWACQRGADAATGDRLLFLDADVTLHPSAIGALVSRHRRTGGLVSVQPHHRPARPYEHLSAIFNAVAVHGSGAGSAVGRWRRSAAVAFGPCVMTAAADYRRVGGHASVRACIAEDLALAKRYRDAGMATEAFLGGDLVTYRMYPDGLAQLVDGWTKNLAAGAMIASRPAVVLTSVWIASSAAVAVRSSSQLAGWATGGGPWSWPAVISWLVVAATVRWATSRVGTFARHTALAFPVPLFAFVAVFARSAARLASRQPVVWRGREVRGVVR